MAVFRYYPEDPSHYDKTLEKKIARHSFLFALFFTLLFWLVEILSELFGLDLHRGGIFPLSLRGLPGILTSPFIHSGYNHLVSNTIPFFILLFALVYYYRGLSYRIFFQMYLLAGVCVWLAARPAWHIGASGVVYALAAFHFTSGVIRNDLRLLVLAIVVVFLYGGMVWGILPLKPEVSWESHLWGALSGITLAVYYRRYRIRRRKFDWEEEPSGEESSEEETGPGENPHDPTSVTHDAPFRHVSNSTLPEKESPGNTGTIPPETPDPAAAEKNRPQGG